MSGGCSVRTHRCGVPAFRLWNARRLDALERRAIDAYAPSGCDQAHACCVILAALLRPLAWLVRRHAREVRMVAGEVRMVAGEVRMVAEFVRTLVGGMRTAVGEVRAGGGCFGKINGYRWLVCRWG